jgi:hypothetical protein
LWYITLRVFQLKHDKSYYNKTKKMQKRATQNWILLGFTALTLFLAVKKCNNNGYPDLFEDDTYRYLSYFCSSDCLSGEGSGCTRWALYVQENGEHGRCGHMVGDNMICTINCSAKYDSETGVLTVERKEVNPNVEAVIQENLYGTFIYKDGPYGERFYSNTHPEVSLVRLKNPKIH